MYGEDCGLRFCRGTCSEMWQGKPRLLIASDQTKLSVSTILNASMSVQLVENWLLTIPFYEIKSCGVVPSSYIKLKRRILQACSFKYSIKKCIFPVVDEVILVASGSPLPSSFLRWACHFLTIDLFLFFSVLFCKLAVNTSNITR